MTAEVLAGAAGVILALVFAYVPGLSAKYGGLQKEQKSLIMLGLLFVVAAGAYGLACAGWAADWGLGITCDKAGAIALIKAFIAAIIANQAIYSIAPESNAVREAKAKRG
jgi:hypothetical protein